jgi:hypothetical protein
MEMDNIHERDEYDGNTNKKSLIPLSLLSGHRQPLQQPVRQGAEDRRLVPDVA